MYGINGLNALPHVASCWYRNTLWKVLTLLVLLRNSCIFLYPALKSACWAEHHLSSKHVKVAREVLNPADDPRLGYARALPVSSPHEATRIFAAARSEALATPKVFPPAVPLCWSYWPVGPDLTRRAHLFLLKQTEGEGC